MIILRGAIFHITVKNDTSVPCSLTSTHNGNFAKKLTAPSAPASECTIHENQLIPYIFKIRSRNKAGILFEMPKSYPY